MSVYSDISKRVGWDARPVNLPTEQAAKEILEKVKAGDVQAFEQAFIIYRFFPCPQTVEEAAALDTISQAYRAGARMYKEVGD